MMTKEIPNTIWNENGVAFRVQSDNVGKYINYESHRHTVYYDEQHNKFYIKLDNNLNPNRFYFTSVNLEPLKKPAPVEAFRTGNSIHLPLGSERRMLRFFTDSSITIEYYGENNTHFSFYAFNMSERSMDKLIDSINRDEPEPK